MTAVRPERPGDAAAIHALVAAAFPSDDEARLVDALRADGDVVFSLVAEAEGDVVGHVLFSTMTAPFRALGLAPVATDAAHRGQGIAARLIEAGLELARDGGWVGVFVLGGDYYRRFGFDPALAAGFASPYAGEHFMALSLSPAGLPVNSGAVDYARAFAGLD